MIPNGGRAHVGTLPARVPKRRLVPAAGLDELLGRAATVWVGVGHGAAQLSEGWSFRCGLFGSLTRAQGTYRNPAGAPSSAPGFGGRRAGLRLDRLTAMKGRAMPVNRVNRVVMGMTTTIRLDPAMAPGLLEDLSDEPGMDPARESGPGGSALGGTARWAGSRISS
jgi:hypothetical protein